MQGAGWQGAGNTGSRMWHGAPARVDEPVHQEDVPDKLATRVVSFIFHLALVRPKTRYRRTGPSSEARIRGPWSPHWLLLLIKMPNDPPAVHLPACGGPSAATDLRPLRPD